MSQTVPYVGVSINPDGSVTVCTHARVIIESPHGAITQSAPVQYPDDVARRLARLENYDPATLARVTYGEMVDIGYRAAPIRESSKATYIRMVYVAEGRSTTLYMDSKGLFSTNAEQEEFARTLDGAEPASRHMVRFPFTLGQEAINRIAQAFKDRLHQAT